MNLPCRTRRPTGAKWLPHSGGRNPGTLCFKARCRTLGGSTVGKPTSASIALTAMLPMVTVRKLVWCGKENPVETKIQKFES